MYSLTSANRYYLYQGFVRMNLGIDGLFKIIRSQMKELSPISGDVFLYYHRSIQDIFNLCFRAGFVIDGFYEECFKTNKEIPMVMIVRLKKVKRDSLK